MNINKNARRIWIGALLGGGLVAAVATATTAMAGVDADVNVKPSGSAATVTAKPTGDASTWTAVPTDKGSTTTVKPTGDASTWTEVPTDKGSTTTVKPTGIASTWTEGGSTDATRMITVTGTVQVGVEAGCIILKAHGSSYQLLGADPSKLSSGSRVRVSGLLRPDILTTCQEGTPLLVMNISPA